MLDSALIAKAVGIPPSSVDSAWRDWVETLTPRDALAVRGGLIREFGRAGSGREASDPKADAMAYISELEFEVKRWLEDPWEMFDFFVGARFGGPNAQGESWHWLGAHRRLWEYRQRHVESIPKGIRLVPLMESSIENFLSNRIEPRLEMFFQVAAKRSSGAEELLRWAEAGCLHLDRALLRSVERWLSPLRHLRTVEGVSLTDPAVIACIHLLDRLIEVLPADLFDRVQSELRTLRAKTETYQPEASVSSISPLNYPKRLDFGDLYEGPWQERE